MRVPCEGMYEIGNWAPFGLPSEPEPPVVTAPEPVVTGPEPPFVVLVAQQSDFELMQPTTGIHRAVGPASRMVKPGSVQ